MTIKQRIHWVVVLLTSIVALPLRPRSGPNQPDCSRYILPSQARPDACITAVQHCQTMGIRCAQISKEPRHHILRLAPQ